MKYTLPCTCKGLVNKIGFASLSSGFVGGFGAMFPVFGRQGFAEEGMQGFITEKEFCTGEYGRKGRQGLLMEGIHGTATGGEGGIAGTGLGYTNIEPFKEMGPLAGVGLGVFCFGLSFRNGFMTVGYWR